MKRLSIMAAGAAFAMLLAYLALPLSIHEMTTNSMEPAIRGQGVPPTRRGDDVVVLHTFWFSAPQEGDLVLVEIPTEEGPVETIRQISRIETADATVFFVRALDPRGLDSRHFGGLPSQNLKGKVMHVFRN